MNAKQRRKTLRKLESLIPPEQFVIWRLEDANSLQIVSDFNRIKKQVSGYHAVSWRAYRNLCNKLEGN